MADLESHDTSSFDGEVEASKADIYESETPQGQQDSPSAARKTGSSSTLLASSGTTTLTDRSSTPVKKLIEGIFPQFRGTERMPRVSKVSSSPSLQSEETNAEILASLKTSWETSDMKYRFDQSVGHLSIR